MKVIRIEDLFGSESKEIILEMFKFLSFSIQDDLSNWIYKNINESVYDGIISWRNKLEYEEVEFIEKTCVDVIKEIGLVLTQNNTK